ncbi:Ribosomal protein S27E [Methanonatronarchaeum thermophilum]|uniref:Small ribosomal subunit protein eS27 n=1 Tax=Methanonatronarchaeum thermophilum TaxID=1927129 RepID=A0A1Y3GBE1_9EURY|nr:30S ribosomal protein S27e [Methanonatronarchaeum thermophilum]OUJ18748.1 Ribosomal protein S27E [Methanonatronarchaeum thermophilum]
MKKRSRFIEVKCKDCENQQVIFNKVSNDVECRICGRTLAKPTGGLAELKSKVVDEVD